ncbi:hypothetical protein EX30DRAFT_349091 [Ascodesmis nigricans]|uniref:UBL3-like ubiquitin domain-containing protein n=1 Tax=Ascodesmis nigricans TaxID=341454 RepID=A0A4S2MWF7_9PEZI|nr:hypothetical protein EX30DRAFT_349091 [Ascodesmis nigricans]
MDGPAVLLPCDNRESTGGLGVGTTTTERMNEAGAVDAAVADPESGDAETENKRPPSISSTPTSLPVTILLQSGARHQFTLDSEYLSRHSIRAEMQKEVLSNPFEMTVYQLKECIWKDWKEDWEQRPASALFIRLIQFGAYMIDNNRLRDCRVTPEGPNVIHMAIRPAEVGDDDITQRSTKGGFGSRDREGTSRTPSCRCVIL